MVDVTPLVKAGSQLIQAYAGGQFKVSGAFYDSPLIVMPKQCVLWDVRGSISTLKEADFEPLLQIVQEIDVVLLGTGERMAFLSPPLMRALKKRRLSVECMDTGAACRTYNVLMAEGRRVAAALLPV
jgi:uncharacterized protein